MFSTLRNRFGIPGVISVIALVFAMFGGAYAASNSSGGGKATASAKAKKGPRGPKGATGPAGPAGAQGPAGPAGAKGDNGAPGSNGSNGTTGTNGTNGTSVTSEPEAPGPNCTTGGTKFKSASPSPAYACNGANGTPGAPGAPGEPWTAGGTLPVGSTETGTFAYSGIPKKLAPGFVIALGQISFAIPLAAALDPTHVVYDRVATVNPDPTHCAGSAADPKAASGYLCVYEAFAQGILGTTPTINTLELAQQGTDKSGAMVVLHGEEDEEGEPLPIIANGAWAVTG